MNDKLRDGINVIAEAVLEAFDVRTPIYDLEKIVQEMGGTIEEDATLYGYDARIEKLGDNAPAFRITLPMFEEENRKRFSIAHELGHLYLHMGYLISDELWKSKSNYEYFRKEKGEMEYQANEFAAAFLMPREMFAKVMIENLHDGYYNMGNVARTFQVSASAAINRGRWLGYLSWE